jgi:glycyl-tRNA synthetase beta chain
VGYDAEGQPTRAAQSFARKQGIAVAKLKVVETPKGKYLAAVSRQKGRPARKVLGELLPQLLLRLSFPRTMYWTSPQGMRFIRPIRWLLALWGGKVIPFAVDGVMSGNATWGHRILANRTIRVRNFADYRKRLRTAGVFIDPDVRRERIENQVAALLKRSRFRRRADSELLDTLVNSVEHPGVILGEFDKEYLALPVEVLVTVMRHHQKYFSVEDGRGRLGPHFLAVIDLDADRAGEIRRGHEAVLRARFHDAQFFWGADQRQKLEERVTLLGQATFVAELGSYHQKVERMVRLSTSLGERIEGNGRRADIDALRRAALLCKCDLTTGMVGEFPELQGVVGGLYARAQGEPESVAAAIYDHYKPAGADDALPETLESSLLSLADKLDTVAGCFSVGLIPSGSRDPYALRRAAAGAVRIIVEKGFRVSVGQLVEKAVRILQQCRVAVEDPAALARSVEGFLGDRARYLFREVRGFAYDEVNAVFAVGGDDLVDALARQEALRRIRPSPHFDPLAVAFKRIRNILEQAGDGEQRAARALQTELLDPGAEQELYHHFLGLRPRVRELREKHDYPAALRLVASLRPHVDRFFDTVLVMTRDEKVRENRLTLLAQLLQEFSTIADFSEIVVTSGNKE